MPRSPEKFHTKFNSLRMRLIGTQKALKDFEKTNMLQTKRIYELEEELLKKTHIIEAMESSSSDLNKYKKSASQSMQVSTVLRKKERQLSEAISQKDVVI